MRRCCPFVVACAIAASALGEMSPYQASEIDSTESTFSSSPIVFVVSAVDTESRFLSTDLFNQTLDLYFYEDTVSWYESNPLGYYLGQSFRDRFRDAQGGGLAISWFAETTPIYGESDQRDCTAIHKRLERFKERLEAVGDAVYWHYHHADWTDPDQNGVFHWNQLITFDGARYYHGTDIELAEEMLAELILNRRYYPAAYRGGWVWENTDFSNWLDEILPFDFSSLSPLRRLGSVADRMSNIYDWSRAPIDWTYYHPADFDYQTPGSGHRTMFRCLNYFGDLTQAFDLARRDGSCVMCYYGHSYAMNISAYIVSDMSQVSELYSGSTWRFATAVDAARGALGLTDTLAPVVHVSRSGNTFTLYSDEILFADPYGAYETSHHEYRRVRPTPAARTSPTTPGWVWTFSLDGLDYSRFAIGGVDPAGNTFVTSTYAPTSYTDVSCCKGIVGNVDGDSEEKVDISDLMAFVRYSFFDGTLPCPAEANLDGDPNQLVDISDLTRLVNYLFVTFTPLSPCPAAGE